MRALALSGGLAALVLGTAVGPATAKPLEREHFRDSFSVVEEEFCGDLTVRHLEVLGSFLVNTHGSDGLAYFLDTFHGTESFTNVTNDKTFTNVFTQVSKDLKLTDNGDGTLTIVVMSAGMNRYFGPDGFLFHDSGHFRFEFGVDHGGTPNDPSDDEEIEGTFRVIKDLTGRTDTAERDFCDDIHEFIG